MKRINFYLFVTMAMLMLSVNSAWAQYVKLTASNGTVSWIPIKGTINGNNIEIYKEYEYSISAINKNTIGSIDLNEVWSESDGSGTQYQVTSIGSKAFYDCLYLNSVVIPSSVTSIGDFAFNGCGGLTSVEIPSSITSIGQGVFGYCNRLASVIIPSSVTNIGRYAFSNCSSLSSVEIPSSVTSIGDMAFNNCKGLISIDIPSSVTSIGIQAFQDCRGLTSVIIPSSVTTIGDGAFIRCSRLTSVTSYITDVFITGTNAFYGCDYATLYVPKGLVGTYQSMADWNSIKYIEEIPSLALSCNNKGKVKINGVTEFTNDMGEVDVNFGVDNTFIFQPNENCQLEQVLIDGLDVTLSVKNNQLTTKIHEGSKMIVTFSKSSGDMNGDGIVNINDVVALVNLILGQ